MLLRVLKHSARPRNFCFFLIIWLLINSFLVAGFFANGQSLGINKPSQVAGRDKSNKEITIITDASSFFVCRNALLAAQYGVSAPRDWPVAFLQSICDASANMDESYLEKYNQCDIPLDVLSVWQNIVKFLSSAFCYSQIIWCKPSGRRRGHRCGLTVLDNTFWSTEKWRLFHL